MNAQNTLFQLMLKDETLDLAISHSLLKGFSVFQWINGEISGLNRNNWFKQK